jgi:Protein of unknown function (DUF3137)
VPSNGVLIAVFVVGLFLVLVAGLPGWLIGRAHRRRLAAFAAARGWSYVAQEPLLATRFAGPPFGLGFDQRAYDVFYGSHHGRDLVAFDYDYSTRAGSADSSATVVHTFAILGVSLGAVLPGLTVDPETLVSRFVGRLTGHDIELESEEFNRAFTVTCEDRKFASDVLNPAMMEYLLQYRHLGWRFDRDCLLVVKPGHTDLDSVAATIEVMDGITARIPEFVWAQATGEG